VEFDEELRSWCEMYQDPDYGPDVAANAVIRSASFNTFDNEVLRSGRAREGLSEEALVCGFGPIIEIEEGYDDGSYERTYFLGRQGMKYKHVMKVTVEGGVVTDIGFTRYMDPSKIR
jgi:hypothetical protein